jgi:hypothetical protein
MFSEHPALGRLEFGHSAIGKPQISATSIRVPVRHLWVAKGFPGYDDERLYAQAVVVFDDVVSSEREICDYTPDRRGFKTEYKLTDGPFAEVSKPVYSFYIGGISYDPEAWIEWNIVAASVHVEDLRVEQEIPASHHS